METRTLYFLQDSVTKQFYTGMDRYRGEFYLAAIYHNEKNAAKKIKEIVFTWQHAAMWDDKTDADYTNDILSHKDLKDFGIVIASANVNIE